MAMNHTICHRARIGPQPSAMQERRLLLINLAHGCSSL
jgi:hypothetical protein